MVVLSVRGAPLVPSVSMSAHYKEFDEVASGYYGERSEFFYTDL